LGQFVAVVLYNYAMEQAEVLSRLTRGPAAMPRTDHPDLQAAVNINTNVAAVTHNMRHEMGL
jgi:hypothetical protein